MVWLAWLVAPPLLVIATTGAVVSSVKLSEAVPVLPKAIGLARHDGVRTVGQPARGERPGTGGLAVTVVAMALPSKSSKRTTLLASPLPLSASFEVIRPLGRAASVDESKPRSRVGPLVLRLKTTAPQLRILPAASVLPGDDADGCHCTISVTRAIKLPSLPT